MAGEKTKNGESTIVRMEPYAFRRRDTAAAFAVSEGVVLEWERKGWLTPVRLPGLRAVRHWKEDLDALAKRLRG